MGTFKPCYWIVHRGGHGGELNRACVVQTENVDADQIAVVQVIVAMVQDTVIAAGDSFKIEDGETET